MYQGPVLASSRITGLGGAFAAIAEGVDGYPVNAAAPAVRMPWSYDWFDYDLSAGITFPSSLSKTDFDNNGTDGFSYENFVFLTLGGNIQFGDWGLGLSLDLQSYSLEEEALDTQLGRLHLLLGRQFFDGQLVLGAGLRGVLMDIKASEGGTAQERELFAMNGAGAELGALWAPPGVPIRIGISGRTEVRGQADPQSQTTPNADGDTIIGTRFLPTHVVLPWEVEAGIAIQIGPRPINFGWVNPDDLVEPTVQAVEAEREKRKGLNALSEEQIREAEDDRLDKLAEKTRSRLKAKYKAIARQKLLISASVVISGPIKDGVGVESFLSQQVDRSGREVSFSPHLGLEAEPISHWLQLRVGSYLEPSRFKQGSMRFHGTGGFDLKILPWSVFGLFEEDTYWRAGGFVDGARDYLGWGVSVGVWH